MVSLILPEDVPNDVGDTSFSISTTLHDDAVFHSPYNASGVGAGAGASMDMFADNDEFPSPGANPSDNRYNRFGMVNNGEVCAVVLCHFEFLHTYAFYQQPKFHEEDARFHVVVPRLHDRF